MRRVSLFAVAMLVIGLVVVVEAGPAFATTTITSPASDYYQLPGGTTPALVNVTSTGWDPGESVYITQCDGKNPGDVTWSVQNDCDFGRSPGPVTADGSGVATFSGGDPLGSGHSFSPFHDGSDAQGKFNCLAPGEASLGNGEPDWHICRIMVTSNNTIATGDQTFRTILFGPPTIPDVPSSVGAQALAAGQLTISFTENFDGGAPISNFHVACTSSNGGVAGSSDSTNTTQNVSGLTAGKSYTCTVVATNSQGSSAASSPSNAATTWHVPNAPTTVVAKSGSTTTTTGSLTVTFKQSTDQGGAAITNNTATCTSSNGGATKTGTHLNSPITVSAVTTGKTYTCTVKSTNSVGTGAASAASAAVIVGSPAPPTSVTAKSGSTTTSTGPLTVTFVLGANNGSAIQSQTATCTATGGVTKTGTHTGATAAPIALTGLTTGKNYTCKVTVKNVRGIGLATAAVPVIEGSPAPPTGVTATHVGAVGSGQIKVHFVIGVNNGSAIQSQTATCTSTNGGVTKTGTHSGATAADITVSSLTPNGNYKCTVFAHNARGNGLPSAPSGSALA
jgi:hypothetical protein